jgi:hypothetical protein
MYTGLILMGIVTLEVKLMRPFPHEDYIALTLITSKEDILIVVMFRREHICSKVTDTMSNAKPSTVVQRRVTTCSRSQSHL